MGYTRRHFSKLLQGGVAVLATRSIAAANPSPTDAAAAWPKFLTGEFFEKLQGSDFRVVSGAGALLTLRAVELKTIRPVRQGPLRRTPDVKCATLRFDGNGAELAEGSYRLRHQQAGKIELYLTPGLPGRYIASLSHVPEDYLKSVSIPRRPVRMAVREFVA